MTKRKKKKDIPRTQTTVKTIVWALLILLRGDMVVARSLIVLLIVEKLPEKTNGRLESTSPESLSS